MRIATLTNLDGSPLFVIADNVSCIMHPINGAAGAGAKIFAGEAHFVKEDPITVANKLRSAT